LIHQGVRRSFRDMCMAPESDVVGEANVSLGARTEVDGKAGHMNTITTLDEPWRISHCMTAWCCLEFPQIIQQRSPWYEPFEALLVVADVTCSLQGTLELTEQPTKVRLTHSSLAANKRGLHTKLSRCKLTLGPSLPPHQQTSEPRPNRSGQTHVHGRNACSVLTTNYRPGSMQGQQSLGHQNLARRGIDN